MVAGYGRAYASAWYNYYIQVHTNWWGAYRCVQAVTAEWERYYDNTSHNCSQMAAYGIQASGNPFHSWASPRMTYADNLTWRVGDDPPWGGGPVYGNGKVDLNKLPRLCSQCY